MIGMQYKHQELSGRSSSCHKAGRSSRFAESEYPRVCYVVLRTHLSLVLDSSSVRPLSNIFVFPYMYRKCVCVVGN